MIPRLVAVKNMIIGSASLSAEDTVQSKHRFFWKINLFDDNDSVFDAKRINVMWFYFMMISSWESTKIGMMTYTNYWIHFMMAYANKVIASGLFVSCDVCGRDFKRTK